jgi:thiol-disulfide isomerase/thioredoxin
MKPIALLIILVGLAGCFNRDPEKTGLEGKMIPSFSFLLSDSTSYLNTQHIPSDKPVVFFDFGPNCSYSRAQMEEIIEDMGTLKDIRFYLLTAFPFSEMKAFYTHYQLDKYPNITVGVDSNNFFNDYFEIRGVPYLAIYGKDHKLNAAFIGKVPVRQIREIAEK